MKKSLKPLLLIIIALTLTIFTLSCAAAGYTVFDTPVFSDDIIFSCKILGGRANYAHKRMLAVIDAINAQVSLTRDSDIARFNAVGAGAEVQVGEHAYALFTRAAEYYELTDGAFNCAALELSELWGVRSGDYGGELPEPEQVADALCYCDPRLVTARAEDGKYYLKKLDGRVKLDFGGIAKGYAVDECVKILGEYAVSSALIDISGNAYFYGDCADNGDGRWTVGVVSPRPRGAQAVLRDYVCAFTAGGGVSAVTSGDYMRYRTQNGIYIPHIICADGMPLGVGISDGEYVNTQDAVISATVIGESSELCDALSTAVCALGLERGGQLLKKIGYKGLIFTEKKYTIIGDVALYKPQVYNGYAEYAYIEL